MKSIIGLTDENLASISSLCESIISKHQITGKHNVKLIELPPKTSIDTLKWLQKELIIKDYHKDAISGTIDIEVDPNKLIGYWKAIRSAYRLRFSGKIVRTGSKIAEDRVITSKSDNLYNIEFDSMSGRIIINNFVLSKPNYNSKNEQVFRYLYEHPNKKFTRKELQKHVDQPIGKDFHKIVENLAFTGDLRTTFFRVSKGTILFRNPITKSAFAEMGIPLLKLSKK